MSRRALQVSQPPDNNYRHFIKCTPGTSLTEGAAAVTQSIPSVREGRPSKLPQSNYSECHCEVMDQFNGCYASEKLSAQFGGIL